MCGGITEPDTKIMSLEATPFAAPFEHVQIVEFFWARGAGEGCGLETNGPYPAVHLRSYVAIYIDLLSYLTNYTCTAKNYGHGGREGEACWRLPLWGSAIRGVGSNQPGRP